MRVLVVDDQTSVRRLIRAALKDLATVDEAPDWPAGIALVGRQTYAAVLLDLGVPGALGPAQMVAGIRSRDPHTRVIVITGRSDARGQLPAGVRMLLKPFDLAELRRAVRGAPGLGAPGAAGE